MIMELPQKFKLPFAEVVKGQLIMEQVVRYEDLMYELSYALRKKNCAYCGKRLKKNNRTIDHRYPRSTGGISIVNNLFPCCERCNSDKDNFLKEEFLVYKELNNETEKREYRKYCEKEKQKILRRIGYVLPEKWVELIDVNDIIYQSPECNLRGKKYYRILEFYNKYKNLPRPIIVDKENKLLDGYNIILFAKDFDIQYIPVIKLENVVILNYATGNN